MLVGGAATVPGVTATLSSPALNAPLTAMTLADGSYRFRALGRGVYDLVFEIPGFRTLVREGVIVEGSRAIRIDELLAESVTVSGAALVVDVTCRAPAPNQPVFLSDISANRSDNVTLVDVRVEKAAVATGGGDRLTLMADAYNLLNSNAVTNIRWQF